MKQEIKLPCPDCSKTQQEYLIFRKAFARFAESLDQLELERLRIRAEQNPEGPSLRSFEPIVLTSYKEAEG